MAQEVWKGDGLTQEDFMLKDECIVVNEQDEVIGHESKLDCHRFDKENPRGILHRAFSVFLFNSEGKLLLQQRAKSKITFPSVWTNTCCSHPLYGAKLGEVDSVADLSSANVPGAKAAAIRKLNHELGIKEGTLKPKDFKFLTRMHYWAADTLTHGHESPWGEHEIDYILFAQANVQVQQNPEEVDDVKYVSLKELQKMMDPSSGLLWSPWFRIIAEKFLVHWWEDLETTLTTAKWVDTKTIYRFDPPKEHMGVAGPYLGTAKELVASDKGLKKQGAYGKVKTHSEPLLQQLSHFDEVVAALRVKYLNPFEDHSVFPCRINFDIPDVKDDNVAFCKEVLLNVILRALDTVEDDMEAFKDNAEKIKHLETFYEVALEDENWKMLGVGKGDEARLVQEFGKVVRVYKSLKPGIQLIIKDITKKMGDGMAEFVSKDLGQGTVDLKEYDRYCHFVAGLVGDGLSRIFSESGQEVPELAKRIDLSNSMGLFLQKTNIIRDYLEDFVDGRAFWPQEVWKKYSTTGSLGDFADPKNRDVALALLNELVTNALQHVPECLEYLSMLHTPEVFRFCAIPQVMAIATLDKVYGNEDVFSGVVKIRKGLACKLLLDSNDMPSVKSCFTCLAKSIASRINPKDPNSANTLAACQEIVKICGEEKQVGSALKLLVPMVLGGCGLYIASKRKVGDLLAESMTAVEVLVLFVMIVCVIYLVDLSTLLGQKPKAQ